MEKANGTVAAGTDTGSMLVAVYMARGVVADTTINMETSDATNSVIIAQMFTYTRSASERWIVANNTDGGDSTDGADFSATASLQLGAVTDDVILSVIGVNSDAGAITSPALAITGLTLSAITNRTDEADTTGGDARLLVYENTVSSGTETSEPTFTYTNASTQSGEAVFLRVRVETPTLAVAFNDSYITPGITCTMTGIGGYDEYTLTYRDPSGRFNDQNVRGCDLTTIGGDTEIATDYEFPNFKSQSYRLNLYADSVLQDTVDATVTTDEVKDSLVSSGVLIALDTWIKSPTNPPLNRPCQLITDESKTYTRDGNILTESHVLGRKNPVIITDVMSGRKGKLVFIVGADLELDGISNPQLDPDNFDNLFDSGETLYMHVYQEKNIAFKPLYFKVSGYEVSQYEGVLALDEDTNAYFKYSVDYIEVDRPDTGLTMPGLFLWSDLANNYATWSDVKTAKATWLEVYKNAN